MRESCTLMKPRILSKYKLVMVFHLGMSFHVFHFYQLDISKQS